MSCLVVTSAHFLKFCSLCRKECHSPPVSSGMERWQLKAHVFSEVLWDFICLHSSSWGVLNKQKHRSEFQNSFWVDKGAGHQDGDRREVAGGLMREIGGDIVTSKCYKGKQRKPNHDIRITKEMFTLLRRTRQGEPEDIQVCWPPWKHSTSQLYG